MGSDLSPHKLPPKSTSYFCQEQQVHITQISPEYMLLYAPHSTTILSITHASLQPTHFTMHTHHLLLFTHLVITVCPPSQLCILSLPTTLICRYMQHYHQLITNHHQEFILSRTIYILTLLIDTTIYSNTCM